MDQDVEIIEIERDDITIETADEALDTNIESTVEDINVEEPEAPIEQMYEGLLGSETIHTDSEHSRYLANQHTISAITGLTETLDEIQALKDTINVKNTNTANYYLWNDENPLQENRKGYFVCLNEDNKLVICSGQNDIFGVTVTSAGFVGNQEEIARDYKYGLVVNAGAVNVRCELDITTGDYVRPNNYGRAKKDELYGYKVISVSNVGGDHYATISLSSLFDGLCDAQDRIEPLETRMDNAEINIASAISLANNAYHTAENTMDAIRVANEASDKATIAVNTVNDMQDDVSNAIAGAEQALTVANATSAIAVGIRNEAVATANQALTDALNAVDTVNSLEVTVDEHTATLNSLANWKTDTNTAIAQLQQSVGPDGAEIQGLVANIDKYRVGDYSQANGITFAQALDILDIGSAYIPTVNHTEVYINEPTKQTTFSRGYYYTWSNTGWVESASTMVNISSIYITGNSNAPYWYVDSNEDIIQDEITYTAHSLYHWEDNAWKKVVTFNSLGRSVGLLQAKADEISASVSAANGAVASLGARVSNTEAQTSMVASMVMDNTNISIGGIVTYEGFLPSGLSNGTYYAVGSASPYDVYKYDGHWNKISYLSYDGVNVKEVNAASIINAVNATSGDSIVKINANHIVFTGEAGFLTAEDLSASGTTIIDGARIRSGLITSNNYFYVSGVVSSVSDLPDAATKSGKYYAVKGSFFYSVYKSDGSSWTKTSFAYDKAEPGYSGTSIDLSYGSIRSKNFEIDSNGNITVNNIVLTGGSIKSNNSFYVSGVVSSESQLPDATTRNGYYYAVGTSSSKPIYESNGSSWIKTSFTCNKTVAGYSGTSINLSNGAIYSKNFEIDNNGNATFSGSLNAATGSFSGNVAATSGTIGGLKIEQDKVYLPSDHENNLTCYGTGMSSTVNFSSPAFWAGYTGPYAGEHPWDVRTEDTGYDGSTWSDYARFYVTNGGHLHAEDADIKGTITATNGTFNGTVNATSGTFNGTVNATSGTFSNVYISNDCLINGESIVGAVEACNYTLEALADGAGLGGSKYVTIKEFADGGIVSLAHSDTTAGAKLQIAKGYVSMSCGNVVAIVRSSGTGSLNGTWTNGSGVAITSDRNKKNTINDIDIKYETFFDKIRPRTFKYNDGTSDRTHTGYIAQEIKSAITESNLTTQDLALIMNVEEINTETLESTSSYYLRYNEFVPLNTWQIQKLKSRVAELEAKVDALMKDKEGN